MSEIWNWGRWWVGGVSCICVCGEERSGSGGNAGIPQGRWMCSVCVCGQLHSPTVAAEQLAGTRCSVGPPPHYWPTAHLWAVSLYCKTMAARGPTRHDTPPRPNPLFQTHTHIHTSPAISLTLTPTPLLLHVTAQHSPYSPLYISTTQYHCTWLAAARTPGAGQSPQQENRGLSLISMNNKNKQTHIGEGGVTEAIPLSLLISIVYQVTHDIRYISAHIY